MTDDLGWVGLEVRPEVNTTTLGSQLGRGLNGPLDGAGRSAGRRLGSILGKTAIGVTAGVMAAGYAAITIGQDAYAEAKEARKVSALTAQTIKTTGHAANISAREVGKLSSAIMRKTWIDDEQIQSGSNLLLTFKNVRNEVGKGNKIFNQATEAAVDMSMEFGSIESTSKMLGKALNDPLKGITALGRAGVTFTEGQKKQIERMVEQNDLLGAQKIILGEVQSQVGGAAAAQADAGDKLGVTIGNIKENIGTVLMPEIDRFANWMSDKGPAAGRKFSGFLRDEAIPVVRDFAGWLRDDAAPAVGELVDQARPLAKELLPAIGDAFGVTRDVLKEALPYAKDFVEAFNDMPDWAKKAIVGGALAGGAAAKLGLLPSKGGGGLGGMLGSLKPVPVFVTNGSALGLGTPVPGAPVPGAPKSTTRSFLSGAAKLAIPFALGYEAQRTFPEIAPFGDKGWLPGTGSDDAGWLDLFKGGEKAVDDFGAAMEDTIPLAELLGGRVNSTGKSVSFLSDRFKALPDGVETAIKTPGLIQSRADVMDLKRKYDLTPREVKTVLRSLGFIEARNQAADVKRAMDLLRDKTITITTLRKTVGTGVGPAYNADDTDDGPPKKRKVEGGTAGRQPVVINLPDGRQLDGYMDDRINANERLKGQRR